MLNCDPETGVCLLPDLEAVNTQKTATKQSNMTVRYVGDPMCSWCWGLSPTLEEVQALAKAKGIGFSVTMGGLRVGGGDPWDETLKGFLRREWPRITEVTGQPIGLKLLDLPHFNYDTEPACRAVVTVQLLQEKKKLPQDLILTFFTAVQRKFYVDGEDPTQVNFYASLCAEVGLDFEEFKTLFNSQEAQQAVYQAFMQSREWKVRGFPSLMLEHDGKMEVIASGYAPREQVLSRLNQLLAA